MKHFSLLILLLIASALSAQAADSLNFSLPQNMDPVFEYYSRNYLSTRSMGRGTTGVASLGGVESVLANPASYQIDRDAMYMELLIKPPVSTAIYTGDNNFKSPVPFGLVAAGGNVTDDLTWGAAYSLPKSLVMDAFNLEMNLGGYLHTRYPVYNLHQLTANLGLHIGELNLGLNVHNQFHYISDFTVLRTFERIREVKYLLRPQMGMLWNTQKLNLGFSYTPQSPFNWDLKYVMYETSLPGEASVGLSVRDANRRYNLEMDWTDTSILNSHYKDRYTYKAGFEADVRKFTYRLGYLYRPQIWDGLYQLPVNTTANADTALWWDDAALGGRVPANDQHLATAGLSWFFKDGCINLGLLYEVSGPAQMAQVNASLGLNFDVFKRRKHPAEK
ncbi:MAG TPA: hypothetical protein PKI63_03285 [Candidatus Cloacimonadota bacterium]|nr:hypothetical protein [Candidatus Cloacimonadota bacterium]HOH78561.1 hypothetical protein [Candidatus Cloacimonadota bacterium]